MDNTFGLIVAGASAAGIDGLKRALSDLPPELPAAIAIVLHTHATSPRSMADILAKQTSLHVAYAAEGDELVPGHLIAPPDTRLLVRGTCHLGLYSGPKINF